jgi:hypothetical protein
MRFRIFALAAIALLCSPLVASVSADTVFGGRAGVTVAKVSVDSDVFDAENRVGFAGTAFLQMEWGSLGIQPELSYLQKGAENFEIDYLELAVLGKLGFDVAGLRPHVFAGVGADYEVDSSTQVPVTTEELDWNAIFGFDVFVPLGRLVLVGDARFAMGLKDVQDVGTVITEAKNRAWSLTAGAGYKF